MKKTIQITGVEIKETSVGDKIVVSEDRNKYEFFKKKKNGDMTKAYEKWQVLQLSVGSSVMAEVDESPQEFTNEKGELIKYTRRTILYFIPEEDVIIDVSAEDEERYGSGGASSRKAYKGGGLGGAGSGGGNGAMGSPPIKVGISLEEKVNILWKERDE